MGWGVFNQDSICSLHPIDGSVEEMQYKDIHKVILLYSKKQILVDGFSNKIMAQNTPSLLLQDWFAT
jgi:hypothetical protein